MRLAILESGDGFGIFRIHPNGVAPSRGWSYCYRREIPHLERCYFGATLYRDSVRFAAVACNSSLLLKRCK